MAETYRRRGYGASSDAGAYQRGSLYIRQRIFGEAKAITAMIPIWLPSREILTERKMGKTI